MLYRRMDANGDYTFGKNMQDFLTGADAVGQAIKTRLNLWLTEWWENLEEGLPMFENILGAPGTPENINAIDILIRDRILNTQDVLSVTEITTTYANRTYSFNASVETIYGSVAIDVALI